MFPDIKLTDEVLDRLEIELHDCTRGLGMHPPPTEMLLLVKEVKFLKKLVRDLTQEGARERYDAGRQAGAQEMRVLAAMTLDQVMRTSTTQGPDDIRKMIQAVMEKVNYDR